MLHDGRTHPVDLILFSRDAMNGIPASLLPTSCCASGCIHLLRTAASICALVYSIVHFFKIKGGHTPALMNECRNYAAGVVVAAAGVMVTLPHPGHTEPFGTTSFVSASSWAICPCMHWSVAVLVPLYTAC